MCGFFLAGKGGSVEVRIEFAPGRKVAIVGNSGEGKTALLHVQTVFDTATIAAGLLEVR